MTELLLHDFQLSNYISEKNVRLTSTKTFITITNKENERIELQRK